MATFMLCISNHDIFKRSEIFIAGSVDRDKMSICQGCWEGIIIPGRDWVKANSEIPYNSDKISTSSITEVINCFSFPPNTDYLLSWSFPT